MQPLLSASDTIVVFVDLQEGIINVGTTNDPQRVRNSAAALADLALAFDLPIVISCVPTTGGTVAPLLAELTSRLPSVGTLLRTTANPMDDEPFRLALAKSGRKSVVIAGVATEVAVRLAALSAQRDGYQTAVAVDACSGFDARTESTTFMQLCSADVELSSVATIAAQLGGDFGTDLGRAAMRALQSTVTLPTHDHDHDHSSPGAGFH